MGLNSGTVSPRRHGDFSSVLSVSPWGNRPRIYFPSSSFATDGAS